MMPSKQAVRILQKRTLRGPEDEYETRGEDAASFQALYMVWYSVWYTVW